MMVHSAQQLHGKLVTLFGGGGFVGRHTAQALMQGGARVRIVQRRPGEANVVRALGNLGQVQFVAADVTRDGHAARAMAGSDIVINLVGSFTDMMAAHGDAAANIARAATAAGVSTLVHMSAIGADADSPSLYGRSKAAGEAAVHAAFKAATIVRPSIIFGQQDQFINRFARLISTFPVIPVVAPQTRFQPVFVGDVAAAVAAAARGGSHVAGQVFELGGPQIISMRALMEWIARRTGRAPLFVDVPDAAAAAMATLTGWMPGAPITRDQWLMLGRDNVVSDDAAGLSALGAIPTALDAVADGWLDQYRTHGRFGGKVAA